MVSAFVRPGRSNRRVHLLIGDQLVVPGPRLAMATEAFARPFIRTRSNEDPAVVELRQGQRVGAARAEPAAPSGTVAALLTTVNEAFDRVAMHAVRRDVLGRTGARRTGCRSTSSEIPSPCPNEIYEQRMAPPADAVADGFTHVAFGDLFLEDVRRYREERLAGTGLDASCFRCGSLPTRTLAREMIAGGLRARICLRRHARARPPVRRPIVRPIAARRSAGDGRPVW